MAKRDTKISSKKKYFGGRYIIYRYIAGTKTAATINLLRCICLQRDCTESPLPPLIILYCKKKFILCEIRPERICKVFGFDPRTEHFLYSSENLVSAAVTPCGNKNHAFVERSFLLGLPYDLLYIFGQPPYITDCFKDNIVFNQVTKFSF